MPIIGFEPLPLVLKATALPTEPQPLSKHTKFARSKTDIKMPIGHWIRTTFWRCLKQPLLHSSGKFIFNIILPKSFVKRRGVCANLSWVNLISRPGFIDWPNRFYFFCNLLHRLNGNEFCSIESCLAPNSANLGREPWSIGYGRRLVYRKSWVRIPALHTGWL